MFELVDKDDSCYIDFIEFGDFAKAIDDHALYLVENSKSGRNVLHIDVLLDNLWLKKREFCSTEEVANLGFSWIEKTCVIKLSTYSYFTIS